MSFTHCLLFATGILISISGTAEQTTACGGIITSQSGTIVTPNFPNNYPVTVNCTWMITVAQNQVLTVRFHRFGVDLSDRVTFYDGNSTSRPVLNGYLGGYWDDSKMSTFRIRTTGPSLLIVFNAWGAPSGVGFSASYWAHECAPFTYGLDYCNNSCSCQQNNTHYCNSTSGSCSCNAGWQSTRCEVVIDHCSLGYQCDDLYSFCASTPGFIACNCQVGLAFNQTKGQCDSTCPTHQSRCSHACGVVSSNPYKEQCYCPHGMQLNPANNQTCVDCPDLFYGEDCKFVKYDCNRANTRAVDKINGSCICYSNWTSLYCTQDVDECYLNTNDCNLTISRCSNTIGDYTCSCLPGYEAINNKMCRDCGRILTNSSGTITSGYYNPNKNDVEVCSWTIAVQPGSVIDLRFNSFQLYNGLFQNPDTVKVFDGANVNAPLLGSFDGLTYRYGPSGYIRSSGNTMHIVRYSGQSSSYGFTASYTSHECKEDFYGPTCSTPCDCFKANTDYCNSTTGQCVCKPQWTSRDCTVDKNECLVDPLACSNYSDCTNLMPGYNCTCKEGLVINNHGQCVYSRESSSSCSRRCSHMCVHIQATGMEHCYCPIGMELIGDSCVSCPFGRYGPNCAFSCSCVRNNTATCNAVNGLCGCKPGWTSSTCSEDINECYFEKYSCPEHSSCQNTPGDYDCVCDQSMGYGNINHRTCARKECHFILTGPSGNITSPEYPNNYYNLANCTWAITAEQGQVISVRIDTFDTEFNYDFLTFYNGDKLNGNIIGRFHGSSTPYIVRSFGNKMFISFTTDSSGVAKGFKATYYAHYCADFMFGDTCTEPCRCNRRNTNYCDNLKGECLCSLGWKGYTCIDDVSECLGINNFLCPPDSDCRITAGNYECICHSGFVKNTSTNSCDPTNSATTSRPTGTGIVHQDYTCYFSYMDVYIPVSLTPSAKLWLRDPSCQFTNNGTHYVINVPYSSCSTEIQNYINYTVMTNTITVHTDIDDSGPVVFGDDYTIDLSCTIPKHQEVDGSFQAVTGDPIVEISENKTLGFQLKEFETAEYIKDITKYPVQIDIHRDVFLELSLSEKNRLNNTLGINVDNCKATPTSDPNDKNSYALISNGCTLSSHGVHIQNSPGPEFFRFSFHGFLFPGSNNNNTVYIHCDVSTCPKSACANQCAAGRRKRRSNVNILVTLTAGPYLIVDNGLH